MLTSIIIILLTFVISFVLWTATGMNKLAIKNAKTEEEKSKSNKSTIALYVAISAIFILSIIGAVIFSIELLTLTILTGIIGLMFYSGLNSLKTEPVKV